MHSHGRRPTYEGDRLTIVASPVHEDDAGLAVDLELRDTAGNLGASAGATLPRTPPRLAAAAFATLAGRLAAQDELAAIIAGWTRPRDKLAAETLLQAAGVPAAPVQQANDALASPYLAARGFFADITHPDAGTHPHQGLSFHFSKSFAGPTTPAPRLGEHTEVVLRDLLGMTDAEIAALAAAGTTADVPPASAA